MGSKNGPEEVSNSRNLPSYNYAQVCGLVCFTLGG
jgi:hypothetical protein